MWLAQTGGCWHRLYPRAGRAGRAHRHARFREHDFRENRSYLALTRLAKTGEKLSGKQKSAIFAFVGFSLPPSPRDLVLPRETVNFGHAKPASEGCCCIKSRIYRRRRLQREKRKQSGASPHPRRHQPPPRVPSVFSFFLPPFVFGFSRQCVRRFRLAPLPWLFFFFFLLVWFVSLVC